MLIGCYRICLYRIYIKKDENILNVPEVSSITHGFPT